MQKKISNKTMAKNVTTSVLIQIVSLGVSFILNFAVPKGIDEYQYAYWQTFVLYLGYVGVLHFGLLDGIILRYGQYDFEELDQKVFRSQFLFLLGLTSAIALASCAVALLFCSGTSQTVIILVALGIISRNIFTYNSYLFQITNRIAHYAKLIIVQRATYGALVIVMLLLGVNDFKWYCLAELAGDVAGITIAACYNKGMYFGKLQVFREALTEWRTNVSAGIMLMLANWSAILLLGSAKMIVQWHWDELVFGKVAFSFSVSNLFLTFVTAISVVLFPALKRMEQDKLPTLYKEIRNVVSPLLLFALICYFPGCWIIEKILPKYAESLPYLGVLLPMVVYTSKINLLTNNYLKAYRKEKQMLAVNIVSVVIAGMLFGISAYVLDNLTAVLVCVVVATLFNSVLSEVIVMKTIQLRFVKDFIAEILLTVVFITSALTLDLLSTCVVYLCALGLYTFVFRKTMFPIVKKSIEILRRKKR